MIVNILKLIFKINQLERQLLKKKSKLKVNTLYA